MRLPRFPRRILLALILTLLTPVPSRAAAGVAAEPPATQDEIDRNRGALARFLDSHPEIAEDVATDAGALRNESYLKQNPEIQAFLDAYPLVQADPRAFLSSRPRLVYHSDPLDTIAPFLVFVFIFLGLLWAIRSYLENRRWSKAAAVQSEIHTKLLDRFGSSQEMLAYMQTDAGKRFLESGTLAVEQRPSRTPPVIGRILGSMQAGLILLVVGIGILFIRSSVPEGTQPLLVLGTLAAALGTGFLLSAVVSYSMSKRLGLLPRSEATQG